MSAFLLYTIVLSISSLVSSFFVFILQTASHPSSLSSHLCKPFLRSGCSYDLTCFHPSNNSFTFRDTSFRNFFTVHCMGNALSDPLTLLYFHRYSLSQSIARITRSNFRAMPDSSRSLRQTAATSRRGSACSNE